MDTTAATIDTDLILTGQPTMTQLAQWLTYGLGEEYTVPAIRKHLLTEEQRAELYTRKLDIADILNGRTGGEHRVFAENLMAAWNLKLDEPQFGYSRTEAALARHARRGD